MKKTFSQRIARAIVIAMSVISIVLIGCVIKEQRYIPVAICMLACLWGCIGAIWPDCKWRRRLRVKSPEKSSMRVERYGDEIWLVENDQITHI